MTEITLPNSDSIDAKRKKRDELCFKCGQHQFNKAVIEAELLQWNQELLSLNNEIAKAQQVAPLKVAPTPEIIPANV